jgi:hypothetical protein
VKWRGLTTEEKSIPVTLGKGQVWLAMSILTYDLSWSGVLRAVEEAGENSSKIITQLFLDLVGDVLIDQGSGAEREVLRKEIRRRAEEHPELLAWGVIPRGITLVELAPAPSTQMTDAGREIFGTK